MQGLIDRISRTRWNYWLGFGVDAFAIVLLMVIALSQHDFSVLKIIESFLAGFIFFTFFEYLVHARLFHSKPRKLTRSFVVGHWGHHKNPKGYDSLPFFFASVLAIVLTIIFSQFFLLAGVASFFSGFLSGYIFYGFFHFLIHHVEWTGGYMGYMQKYHQRHHQNHQKNMGVTSPVWDMIFQTRL